MQLLNDELASFSEGWALPSLEFELFVMCERFGIPGMRP